MLSRLRIQERPTLASPRRSNRPQFPVTLIELWPIFSPRSRRAARALFLSLDAFSAFSPMLKSSTRILSSESFRK